MMVLWKNVLLSLATFVLLFAFLEVLFRAGLYRENDPLKEFWMPDPVYGSRGIPNKSGPFSGRMPELKEFISYPRTNGQGFFDDEFALEKPENTYRMALLGDSFTQAAEVNVSDAFHHLLEKKLNENSAGKRYEVMNFGIGNTGTDKHYLLLKNYVLEYGPDLVVLDFFVGNDVQDTAWLGKSLHLPYFELDNNDGSLSYREAEKYEPPLYKRALSKSVALSTIYRKLIYSPAFQVSKARKEGRISDYWMVYSANYSEEWNAAWELTRKLILEMKSLSEENGARFLLVVIPADMEVHPERWGELLKAYPEMKNTVWDLERPERILGELCSSSRMDCLFLLPEFVKESGKKELYYKWDKHLNAEGNRLAANVIYGKLIKELNPAA